MLRTAKVAEADSALDQNEKAYGPKAHLPPRTEKGLSVWPAVEGQAECIGFKNPKKILINENDPSRIRVALNWLQLASPPAGVADEVRVGLSERDRSFLIEAPEGLPGSRRDKA